MPEGALTVEFVRNTGWVLFAATTALSIALGLILAYHWAQYAMNKSVPVIALVVYAGGCFLLLFAMLAAVISLG